MSTSISNFICELYVKSFNDNKKILAKVLYKCLLRIPVGTDEEKVTLMQLLGKQMGQEMTELLIKDCLAEAVPCSLKQLGDYDVVRETTQEFQV